MEELFVPFAITILSYGAGPVILAFVRKRPISKRALIIFCVVYSLLVFSAFTALRFYAGMAPGSATPAFIWGILFYFVSSRHLRNSGRLFSHKNMPKGPGSPLPTQPMAPVYAQPAASEEPQAPTPIDAPLYSGEPSPCTVTEPPATDSTSSAEKKPSAKLQSMLRAPLFWCFLFSVALSIALGVHAYSLSSSLNAAAAENEQLNEELTLTTRQLKASKKTATKYIDLYNEIRPEYEFWHDYAVIVTTTGTRYHTYSCPHIEGRRFFIYNLDSAISRGYTPCLDCNPPR